MKSTVLDNTGEDCAVNQSGNVWFLAGTSGGTAERDCTIPTGKQILFPIVNYMWFDIGAEAAEENGIATVLFLGDLIEDPNLTTLEVIVDGVALSNENLY